VGHGSGGMDGLPFFFHFFLSPSYVFSFWFLVYRYWDLGNNPDNWIHCQ
jgi:hypothetical protein